MFVLRSLIRSLIIESQLEDARLAQQAWNNFVKILKDPKRVLEAVNASPLSGGDTRGFMYPSLRIEGSDVHPALDGYFIHASPDEDVVFTDRFLDMDPEGNRVHPDKELQVVLDMPGDLTNAIHDAKKPEVVAKIISDWAQGDSSKLNGPTRMSSGFMHEFLHVLHAERAGPDAIQRSFMGPQHPTSKKRLKARLKKKQGDLGPRYGADVDRSTQSSESYADMDVMLTSAMLTLKDEPDISLSSFINKTLPFGKQRIDRSRRAIRMLSKMWHDAQAKK